MAGIKPTSDASSARRPVRTEQTGKRETFSDSTSGKIGDKYLKESLMLKQTIHSNGGEFKVGYTDDGKTMQIAFKGDGLDIDAKNIREQLIYRKYDFGGSQLYTKPKTTPPERVVVKIEGCFNRFHGSPVGADIYVTGDNNIIQASDQNDNITINGISNIVAAYDGNDNIKIEHGSGNNIYLGDGNDTFTGPKEGFANIVRSGDSGHDSVKNGTYIKNKNLNRNNIDALLKSTKQKASEAGEAIANTGSAISNRAREAWSVAKDVAKEAPSAIKKGANWYANGGISDEGLKELGETVKKAHREKLKEEYGADIISSD